MHLEPGAMLGIDLPEGERGCSVTTSYILIFPARSEACRAATKTDGKEDYRLTDL